MKSPLLRPLQSHNEMSYSSLTQHIKDLPLMTKENEQKLRDSSPINSRECSQTKLPIRSVSEFTTKPSYREMPGSIGWSLNKPHLQDTSQIQLNTRKPYVFSFDLRQNKPYHLGTGKHRAQFDS